MWTDIAQVVTAGFIGWVLHGSIAFYRNRINIRTYLSIALPAKIKETETNCKIQSEYLSNKIVIGQLISIPPNYKADTLDAIICVKPQIIEYLTNDEIIKFTNLVFCLAELEALYEGFCNHIKEHEKGKKVVDEEFYKHLDGHLKKSQHLVNQLIKIKVKITSLRDLPNEYDFITTI
ncbi:MAG: hypothetical protein EPN14_08180 [Gallionella sp.]|nr:MAG: hypothetical protein EPN14_08180 [Gallionella sp.]